MKNLVFLLIVSSPVASSPSQGRDDAGTAIASRLQGKFEGVEIEIQGQKGSSEEAKGFVLVFQGDEVTFSDGGDARSARKSTFKIDASAKPMRIDLKHLDGREKDGSQPCIFSLEGDTLTFCAPMFARSAKAHPKEFKTKKNDGLLLVVLKRTDTAKALPK